MKETSSLKLKLQKQQNLLWLTTSLFCSKSHWSYLISEGIKPFLSKIDDQKSLKSYQLEFNYQYGDNIRLSLLAQSEQAKTLSKKADAYFKKFFSIAALPTNETNLTDRGIFMPIPPNTIQYGLYKIESIANEKQSYFQKELSLIIIEGLGKENIDQETIITFGFYLHIALIKLIKDKHEATVKELLQWYNSPALNVTDKEIDIEFIKAKYEDNKEVLLEITDDIMKPPSFQEIPFWLKKWMKLCEDELNRDRRHNKETNQMTINTNIINIINKHLGITEKMKTLLFYFIRHTIII